MSFKAVLRLTPKVMCHHYHVSQMRLVGLLMVQSGFKHLLTEGDKVLQLAELANTHIS
jgi:hypothetical protein